MGSSQESWGATFDFDVTVFLHLRKEIQPTAGGGGGSSAYIVLTGRVLGA